MWFQDGGGQKKTFGHFANLVDYKNEESTGNDGENWIRNGHKSELNTLPMWAPLFRIY